MEFITGRVSTISRREVLIGGAIAANWVIGSRKSIAVSASRVIDTHHHFYPPAYIAKRRAEILAMGPGFPHVVDWTPAQSLAAMDQAGIAKAILSMSAPGVWFDDVSEARTMTRACNEFAADLTRSYPRRFGFFAALALPDVEGSLLEIAYALEHLHADGIGLFTNYDSRYLGDPLFEPVMVELDRRSAVVYVHPTSADCCKNINSGIPMASLEFPFDTTRTIASLALTGTLAKFPNIRFIFSHGGGTVPFLIGRMASFIRSKPELAALFPNGLQVALAKHFYDTVSISAPSSIAALRSVLPVDQLLFGTDFPYFTPFGQLQALDGFNFSAEDYARVAGGNAALLLAKKRG